MSTPGAIAVYVEAGSLPDSVDDRRWRGVSHHWSSGPDGLGEELIREVGHASGDLASVVRKLIDQSPHGWSSLREGNRFTSDEPGFAVSPEDHSRAAFVYVFDVAARRLDLFATHAEAKGERLQSVTFSPEGVADPPCFAPLPPRLPRRGPIERLGPGDRVRVVHGPYAAFTGTVETVTEDRATVVVEIFGRKSKADFSFTDLEAASAL